jgi:hypothetical protein
MNKFTFVKITKQFTSSFQFVILSFLIYGPLKNNTCDFDELNVAGPAVCDCLTIRQLECDVVLSTVCDDESTRTMVGANREGLSMPDG